MIQEDQWNCEARMSTFIVNKFLFLILLSFLFVHPPVFARDYIIYSVVQDFPMGHKDEKLKKNFFVNMGEAQGIKIGTALDVFRTISQIDPYNNNKRHNFKVKVGELKVIHVENESAITVLSSLDPNEQGAAFELQGLLIGDAVDIHLK